MNPLLMLPILYLSSCLLPDRNADVVASTREDLSTHELLHTTDELTEASSENPQSGSIVRLNRSAGFEGFLEIYFKDDWGAVCAEKFTEESATVVCKMLGAQ